MSMRVTAALGLILLLGIAGQVHAQTSGDGKADNPDGSPPLLTVPNASAATPEPSGEVPGRPPPRALDSARTPMPDRLANDHWMQYFPLAPPTPPVPESGGTTGGGAKRVNNISKGAGGAPPDIPRDSVTRTPEDQLAPPPAPATQAP